MPQNTYTNADLKRFERRPSRPEDMEVLSEVKRDVPPMDPQPSVEALLSLAQGTLDRSNKLARETGSADIAQIPRRMENLKAHGATLPDPIDMMADASAIPGIASLAPTPASPVLGAISGLMMAPRGVRSMIQADDWKGKAMGALETGLGMLPFGLGLRGGKAAAQAAAQAQMADDFPRVLGGRASSEVPYASAQRATNPNQTLEVARDIAAENGDDLASVLKASSKGGTTANKVGQEGYNKQSARALLQLAESGPKAKRAADLKRVGLPDVEGVNPRDFMGDRTTGYRGELPQLFADDLAGKGVYPLPESSRYMSEVDNLAQQAGLTDELADFSIEAVDDLPPAATLPARPGRSLEALELPITTKEVPANPRTAGFDENPIHGDYKRKQQKRAKNRRDMKPGQFVSQLKGSVSALLPQMDDVLLAGTRNRER